MKLQYLAAPLLLAAMPLTACFDSPAEAPSRRASTTADPLATMTLEGEVLVKLYENGSPITSNDYEIELIPFNDEVASRLHGSTSLRMWYNPLPTQGWGASWYDPDSNDGAATCGELLAYNVGDMDARGDERHDPAPGVAASGKEMHCIRPGRYRLKVLRNDSTVQQFDVEYAQATLNAFDQQLLVSNDSAPGISERVISPQFISRHGGPGVIDLRIAIDVGQTFEAGSDQPRLDLENAGPDHKKTFFHNESAPAGTKYDVFRASVARSSYQPVGIAAGVLSKIWWDTRNNVVATGYYDLNPNEDGHAIVTHTYQELPDSAQTVAVGLDFMRYNEPVGTPEITRSIQLQRLGMPNSCLLAEATQASMDSDQLVRIGDCASRGVDVEYSWKLGNAGAWTPFGQDTIVEYVAPSIPGTDTVSLRVRNNSGVTATSHVAMTVSSSILEITGPTYITTKATNTYTASRAANWFERMTGEAAWRFNGVTDTSMNRIWALGNYHVDLRADSSTTSNLLRGRLGIDVCATNCTPENSLFMASRSAPRLLPDIFGGGPVLASATGKLVRGYDLTGMHEPGSSFRSADWLENTEWRAFDAPGYRVEWRREAEIVGGVHAFTFHVQPAATGAYQFGFALDPDLGTVAWDDRAEYDGSRQLLIVRDGQRALGVMLLRTGQPVDVLPRQFGTVVFAPTSAAGITMELRNPGRRLFNRQDDVQVLLRGGSADGESAWKLLLVEAATPAHVQQLVDGYRAVSR